MRPRHAFALLTGLGVLAVAAPVAAQDGWNPFRERDSRPAEKTPRTDGGTGSVLAPMQGWFPGWGAPADARRPAEDAQSAERDRVPVDSKSRAVERTELMPVMAGDGSGLPLDLWQGLDLAGVEKLLASLDIPPRSPALHGLWRRLLSADVSAPAGASTRELTAIRAEGLYRSGLLEDLDKALAPPVPRDAEALIGALKARSQLASGRREEACRSIQDATARKAGLPPHLRGEALAISGYCAAAGGNPAGAGLAADLAREEQYGAGDTLALLDAVATGQGANPALPKRMTVLDYRLLVLAGAIDPVAVLARAEAPLLAAIVRDSAAEARFRLAAAEAAVRRNIVAPDALLDIYRAQTIPHADLADPLALKAEPLLRRAVLLQGLEREHTPARKARLIRALLDDARRVGLYLPMLRAVGPQVELIPRTPEFGWFVETAIEVVLAAGRLDDARGWASLDGAGPGDGLRHWLALADIADPAAGTRGDNLRYVESLALAGRLAPDVLHRLATVLDALDYNVPLRLWEAASRTPQPIRGHLPETGVLADLQDASKKKEIGRLILLSMQALGPEGAEGAHMLALGDVIRALKRARLEADARRLAFESLFASWPRLASH